MFQRKALDGQASAIMLLLCPVWGGQQVLIKAVAAEIAPLLQIVIRSGVAAVLVGALGLWVLRQPWRSDVNWRAKWLVGALFALEFWAVAEGLRWTSASHMVVFLYTAPLFAAMGLHWRLPQERLSLVQWLGIVLAFAGIVWSFLGASLFGGASGVGESGGAGSALPANWLLGDALGLFAGAAWGLTTVVVRTSDLSEAPPTQTLFYQLLGGCVLLLPVALATGQTYMTPSPAVWGSLAFQAIVVCFISYLTWFWLLRRYLAAPLGVLSLMTPLLGVALGVWLLDEPLLPEFVTGAALVLLGLLVMNARAWWPLRRIGKTPG